MKIGKKNEIGNAQLAKAIELGKAAFENGLKSAPAFNKEVFNIVGYRMEKDTPKGECSINDIMIAYGDAWHKANLANARKLFV